MFKFIVILTLFCICTTWSSVHGTSKAAAPPWQKFIKDKETTATPFQPKKGPPTKESPWGKKAKGKPWLLKAKGKTTTTEATPMPNFLLGPSAAANSVFISKLFDALAAEVANSSGQSSEKQISTTVGGTSPSPDVAPTPIPLEDQKLFENLILLSLHKPPLSPTKTSTAATLTETSTEYPAGISTATAVPAAETTTGAAQVAPSPTVANWTETKDILRVLAPNIAAILQNEAATSQEIADDDEPNSVELSAILNLVKPQDTLPVKDEATLSPLFQALLATTEGPVESSEDADDTATEPTDVTTTPADPIALLPLPLLLQLLLQNPPANPSATTELPSQTTEISATTATSPDVTKLAALLAAMAGVTPRPTTAVPTSEESTTLTVPTSATTEAAVETTESSAKLLELLTKLVMSVNATDYPAVVMTETPTAAPQPPNETSPTTEAPQVPPETPTAEAVTEADIAAAWTEAATESPSIELLLSLLAKAGIISAETETPTEAVATTTTEEETTTEAFETTESEAERVTETSAATPTDDLETLVSILLNITKSVPASPAPQLASTTPETTVNVAPTASDAQQLLLYLLLNQTSGLSTETHLSGEAEASGASTELPNEIQQLLPLISGGSLTSTTAAPEEASTVASPVQLLLALLANYSVPAPPATTSTTTTTPAPPLAPEETTGASIEYLLSLLLLGPTTTELSSSAVPATTTVSPIGDILPLAQTISPKFPLPTTTTDDSVETTLSTVMTPDDARALLLQLFQATAAPPTSGKTTENPELAPIFTALGSTTDAPTEAPTVADLQKLLDSLSGTTEPSTSPPVNRDEVIVSLLQSLLVPTTTSTPETTIAPATESPDAPVEPTTTNSERVSPGILAFIKQLIYSSPSQVSSSTETRVTSTEATTTTDILPATTPGSGVELVKGVSSAAEQAPLLADLLEKLVCENAKGEVKN